MNEIDFVIPWVDGSDKQWQANFNRYAPKNAIIDDTRAERYRDWGLLKYWFRGVEQFTPWVRKIHFITCGQLPEWINLNAPKLHWVKHEDYIPQEYLPVFNSNTIELCIHKIQGLSDQFVYFNDDYFIIRPLPQERFFRNGLPCDTAICNLLQPSAEGAMTHIMANNMAIINQQFDKHQQIKQNWHKWFNLTYGIDQLRTALLLMWPGFSNLYEHHLPNAFLKSTFEDVWRIYGDRLLQTSMTRFRDISNCNQWLIRDWQLVKGNFNPINVAKDGISRQLGIDDINQITDIIRQQQKAILVINDSNLTTDQQNQYSRQLIDSFERLLPTKSTFEK